MNRYRLALLGATAAIPLAGPAQAQEDARLNAIEAQIKSLQSELARVRHDLATSRNEARTLRQQRAPAPAVAQTAPPPSSAPQPGGLTAATPTETSSAAPPQTAVASAAANPGGVSFPNGRPTWTSNDGRFSAAVGLQLHYDIGGEFQGSHAAPDTRQFSHLDSFGQNLRRGRIPFVFKYDDFQINITPDFGGSPDGTPSLYEANVNWSPKGTPLTATVGYFKPWLTLQDSMSSNDFLFLERPSVVEASRNIAAGDARSSFGVRWAENRYFLAAYLTGAPYASQTAALAQPQQTGATIRAAGRPVASSDFDVHLGFSASDAFRLQRTGSGETLNIQDRPELRIDQNRLVSTGALNANSAYSYGPEVGFRWRNLMVQGEYIRMGVQRPTGTASAPTPDLEFDGGYIEASWVITGEPRKYNTSEGAFGAPKVAHPFNLREGGAGAFELVGRYSHLNLNDHVTRGMAASVTGGVYGGEQNIYSIGLNWYPNDVLRFMLDYDIVNVDKLNAAGTTQIGQRIQAVGFRAQAAF